MPMQRAHKDPAHKARRPAPPQYTRVGVPDRIRTTDLPMAKGRPRLTLPAMCVCVCVCVCVCKSNATQKRDLARMFIFRVWGLEVVGCIHVSFGRHCKVKNCKVNS